MLSEGITTKGNCTVMFVLNSRSMISASWSSGSTEKPLSATPRARSVGKKLQLIIRSVFVPPSKLIDGGAVAKGPVVDVLESKDSGDLGKRASDVWPNGLACKVDWFDFINVIRPSSFCSSLATRLNRRSVTRKEGEGGLGTYVGSDVRVRLRVVRSCKKQCFLRR